MTRRYFGTDGIRGRVGEPPITPDFVLRLGYAAGRVLAGAEGASIAGAAQLAGASTRPTVIVGKDTRVSGYMLEAALQAGFSAAGVDVLRTGPLPTPAIAYLTRALRVQAGVVLSASHNPYEDNGIKFFAADGDKLPGELELAIEAQLEQQPQCVPSAQLGRARRIDDAPGRYIEFCKSSFPAALGLRGLRIVVDCANGAGYHTAPHVFHELGADVVPMAVEPTGTNINEACGATDTHALQREVLARGADLGIAIDGDADRVIMVGADGRVYDGDALLYAIVRDRAQRERVDGVVGTSMSNFGLEQAFARMGIAFARAQVGDRHVLEMLRSRGWRYGGENSGHILCLDRHSTGDGTISALQVLAAMRRIDGSLADVCTGLELYPQTLINVPVRRGFDWCSDASLQRASAEAVHALGESGRVLIRPSGTEPLLRVMVEAREADVAQRMAQQLAQAVQAAL